MNMQRDIDDPILTTREAARLLGVAVSTAQLWMESGALPAWKTPGGHRRVRMSAVAQLLAQQGGQRSSLPAGATEDARLGAEPGDDVDAEFLAAALPSYPAPSNEAERLAALRASGLMDSAEEEVFDRLTWLATQVTECPMALLTLLSSRRQWFKSRVGVELGETPREWAFCSHAIMEDGPFVVEDARRDARFQDNPLVKGEPHIRFYAGYPLLDANGLPFGTLCVLDREARRLRERELRALRELAAIASDEIKRRA
jgi:excisionase family DNA binding protein